MSAKETWERVNRKMKWEYLGTQELAEGETANKGYVYVCSMWRTPVPGGWLLLTLNRKSNDPHPIQSFYPDADHLWTGRTPPEAGYLLRAAGSGSPSAGEQLLRASEEDPSSQNLLDR
jgi:hypothetical protein